MKEVKIMNKLTKSILILAGAIALTGCGQIHPTGYQKLPQIKSEVQKQGDKKLLINMAQL